MAKRARRKEADRKKKERKAIIKELGSVSLGGAKGAGENTPVPKSGTFIKSSRANRTNKIGRVMKSARTEKPFFKEVSQFSQIMADGTWLLTERCYKDDPLPDIGLMIEVWGESRRIISSDETIPTLVQVSSFGK